MNQKNIVLIGAGIMSATLGVLLKKMMPDASITIYERLDSTGAESSESMNNAGTGHSAFCELNYTPLQDDGSINISKAVKIATSFELSKEFWTSLILENQLPDATNFIHAVPHCSFVWGKENVSFLHKRYESMRVHPLFASMKYSDDKELINSWIPLVMKHREAINDIACTKMDLGTDINFGELTDLLFKYLCNLPNVQLHLQHEVRDLEKTENQTWNITVKNFITKEKEVIDADFVFIGAGGGSLALLEKSNIKEAEGYGGFPISGQWLVCNNEQVIQQHHAKVYGKASVGAPPMSVPHLDTRIIDGKKKLLFGPFAGFSTKFLKHGSYWDLPASIEFDNILPMMAVGIHNLSLTKYLIEQVNQSDEDRIEALKQYLPDAQAEDWELAKAGQRVQVIKKDEKDIGVLEFGTELVCAGDGSLAALLGASPGASTAVVAMIDVLKKCFATEMKTTAWQNELVKLMPHYSCDFNDENTVNASRKYTQLLLEE